MKKYILFDQNHKAQELVNPIQLQSLAPLHWLYDFYFSHRTQPPIQIQHTVICILIRREENRRIGNFFHPAKTLQRNRLQSLFTHCRF